MNKIKQMNIIKPKSLDGFYWKCKKCDKELQSLSYKQLEFQKASHEVTHK